MDTQLQQNNVIVTMFKQGNTFGKGRQLGSKNKLANREKTIELLDKIIEDFQSNYELLSIDDKLRLLSTFRQLYNFEVVSDGSDIQEIRVNIIQPPTYEPKELI
jgi:archaellum component FlaC